MTIAATSQSRVAFVPEVTSGTIPATPSFALLRRTSGNLRTNKTTAISDEIQLDRNVRDEYQLGQDVMGSYDFELTYGTFDTLLAALLQGAWTSNALVNGTVQQPMTFEETIQAGGATLFSRFAGVEINTATLTFASRAAVKGTMSLMGRVETPDTAAIAGATYAAANSNPVMTSASVAALGFGALTTQPKIKTLAITVNNNMRIRDQVGSLYSQQFGNGQCEVTGTFDAYFETNELYQAVLSHQRFAISLTVGAVANQKYTITLPACILLNGERKLGGKNDDVMASIPFRAVFDPTTGGSIQLQRAVA